MRLPKLALLAVGLMTLACAPAHAQRELFTQDCQGQVHLMGGFVSIGGAPDGDGMWSHIVRTLKARLACKCGANMNPDEFLRKFSVTHALLNLLSLQPDTTSGCQTAYSLLHPVLVDGARDYIRKYVKGKLNGPLIPCSYKDLASAGGCKFELKPTGMNLDFGFGVAMKTCPSNSDWTFVSVVAKGTMVNNLAKPCDAQNTCGSGLKCTDVSTLWGENRRSGGLWSVFESFDKLVGAIKESKPFDKLVRFINEKLPSFDMASRRSRGRRLLKAMQPSNKDFFEYLYTASLYDSQDRGEGCLTFSQLVANARGYLQAYFPQAIVAQNSQTYNFCIPDGIPQFDRFDTELSIKTFLSTNWGVTWTDARDTQVTVPFTSWDGGLSRGRNVLDADRLDGSYFVGSTTALRPPAINKEQQILPLFGATCSGTVFMQVGDKLGMGMSFPGPSAMFSFIMEQALKMQQCRATERNKDFVLSRPDFMKHFALYTPLAWLSLLMKPPAGMEYNVMAEKLANDWSNLEITMSTVMKKMFAEMNILEDLPMRFDLSSVSTCTAKGYSTQGCKIAVDVSKVGLGKEGTKAVFGMMQCFSASPTVSFPAIGLGLRGGNTPSAAWPLKSCSVNSDCPVGLECADGLGLTNALIDLDDPFDMLLETSSDTSTCASRKYINNKGVAKIIEYLTGTSQAVDKFAFCLPKFTVPDFGTLVPSSKDRDGKDLYSFSKLGIASYTGVLPGINDQPSIVFFFPPSDSEAYTWPQKTERRVLWTGFNLPPNSKVTLKLMNAGFTVDTKSLDNDNSEPYTMAAAPGPGYWMEICSVNGQCWASGKFTVIAEVTNRVQPVEGSQSWPSGGLDVTPGSEVYGVFAGAVQVSIAEALQVASHRVEIASITTTARRAGSSLVVKYLIQPDDTGKDDRTVGALVVKAQSPATRDNVVGNFAAFSTSAQTTNPAVMALFQSGVFNNVTEVRKVQLAFSQATSRRSNSGSNILLIFFVALCSVIDFW